MSTSKITKLFTKFASILPEDTSMTKNEVLQFLHEALAEVPKAGVKKERSRAKTAYMFFTGDADVKSALTEEHLGDEKITAKEMTSLMAAKWKTMDEGARKKYEDMHNEDLILYPAATKSPKEKERTRAKTPYNFFMGDKEVIEKIKSDHPGDGHMAHMAAMWKSMDEEGKGKYEKMSCEDKLNFPSTSVSGSPKEKKVPKQSASALKIYQSTKELRTELKEQNPDAKPLEITQMMSTTWKDMSDEDKTPYKQQAEKDKKLHSLLSTDRPLLERSLSH